MSLQEPECNFFGVKIAPGKSAKVQARYDEDMLETIHLTQVALGDKPKSGPHTVFIEKEGEKFAIGTLDSGKCPQFSMDITLATDEITLSHTGGSDVYVTGYQTVAINMEDDEDGYMLGSSDDEEGDEEFSSSDDDEPPRGVPISNGKAPARRIADDEADESSGEEESEDEDDMGLGGGSEDDSEDDDSEEDDSEEEEEEEDEPAPPPQKQQKAAENNKRPAAPSKTPQPAKKAKAAPVPAAPASAPAKPASGGDAYVSALRAYLQQSGPTKIATLGSKVQRPDKGPKLKAVVGSNPKIFKYNAAADTVELA